MLLLLTSKNRPLDHDSKWTNELLGNASTEVAAFQGLKPFQKSNFFETQGGFNLNDHNPKQPSLSEGTVIWAEFAKQSLPDKTNSGHEMEGKHPAIVLAVPPRPTRFELLTVIPITTLTDKKFKDWVLKNPLLYLLLPAGAGGLPENSIVLTDQIRSLDARRVLRIQGKLTPVQFKFIKNSVRLIVSD